MSVSKTKKCRIISVVLFAAMLLSRPSLRAEDAAISGCPFSPSQVLWFDKPAAKWGVDTLPLGNGRLGAMIFGGMQKERIQFNEDSLWALLKGLDSYQAFGDLVLDFSHADGSGYRRSLDISRAVHTLTYTSGGVNYRREYFASHPAGVIVCRFTADRPGAHSGTLALTDMHEAQITSGERRLTASGKLLNSKLPKELRLPRADPKAIEMEYESQVLLLAEGGKVEAKDGKLQFTSVDALTIYLDAGTDYLPDYTKNWRGEHPHAKILSRLEKAAATPYAKLLDEHVKDYQSIYGRLTLDLGRTAEAIRSLPMEERLTSYGENWGKAGWRIPYREWNPPPLADEAQRTVDLRRPQSAGQYMGANKKWVKATPGHSEAKGPSPDPELETLLYQYARYLMLASSRGHLPVTLQGVWCDSNQPAWGCDYTVDVNLECSYWAVDQMNLPGCFEPLSEWLWSVIPVWRDHGKKLYKRGWLIRANATGLTGTTYGLFTGGDAFFLAQGIWDHYAFTQDRFYLEKRAYPILKELCEWCEDNLKTRPDGKLVFPESISPEHGTCDPKKTWQRFEGNSYCQQLVWEAFSNYIQASQVFGVDEEFRHKVEAMRARLLGPQVGAWGQLQEWAQDIDHPRSYHRHTSGLVGLYPGRQITPAATPEWAKAAAVTIAARGEYADSSTCGGFTHFLRAAMWARLGDGDRAYHAIPSVVTRLMHPNLWTYYPAHGDPIQLEGNTVYAAAVGEMLLQSHEQDEAGLQIIRLLPALPKAWPSGSVKGICARGGFAVDMSWKDGVVVDATIRSSAGTQCVVMAGGKSIAVKLSPGESKKLIGAGQLKRERPL